MTNAIVIVLTYVAVLAAGTGPAAAQARGSPSTDGRETTPRERRR